MDILLISEARPPKPETTVVAELDGIVAAMCNKHFFRCTCGDKYVSGVWLSAHITREGIGHRRQMLED